MIKDCTEFSSVRSIRVSKQDPLDQVAHVARGRLPRPGPRAAAAPERGEHKRGGRRRRRAAQTRTGPGPDLRDPQSGIKEPISSARDAAAVVRDRRRREVLALSRCLRVVLRDIIASGHFV